MALKVSNSTATTTPILESESVPSKPIQSSISTFSSLSTPTRRWMIIGLVVTLLCGAGIALRAFFRKTVKTKKKKTPEVKPYIGKDPGSIIDNTLALISQGYYKNAKGEKFTLENGKALSRRSKYYEYAPIEPVSSDTQTKITVVNQDCLEAAEGEARKGTKVLLLNFASPEFPGASLEKQPGKQEEDLCYRSELLAFMQVQQIIFDANLENADLEHKLLYPLYSRKDSNIPGAVHTPNVTVFRSGRTQSYALLASPFRIGIVSSAAPHELKNFEAEMSRKKIKPGSPEYLQNKEQLLEQVKQKAEKAMINQLTVAYQEKYDCIVLGAFGCGSFKIPPEIIAGLYKKVIQTFFKGAFKQIIFAILDEKDLGNASQEAHNLRGNLKPFQECFSQSS